MKCDYDKILNYLKNQLNDNDKIELKTHLEKCPKCRDAFKILSIYKQKKEIEPKDRVEISLKNRINRLKDHRRTGVLKKGFVWSFAAIIFIVLLSSIYMYFMKQRIEPDIQYCFVTFYSGNVEVKSSGRNVWKNVNIGQRINPYDIIKTDRNSDCFIQFNDNALIRLCSNTEIYFQKLYYSKKLKKENTQLRFVSGKMFVKIKKLLKNSQFTIKTVTATIGVRGTTYSVETSTNNDLIISAYEGKITIIPNIENIEKEIKPVFIGDLLEKIELTNNQTILIRQSKFDEFIRLRTGILEDVKNRKSRGESTDKDTIRKNINELNNKWNEMIKPGVISNDQAEKFNEFEEIEILNLINPIGRISIKSIPDNADVYIEGKKTGITPFGKMIEAEREYEFIIKKEDYKEHKEKVALEKGEHKKLDIKLKKVFDKKKTKNRKQVYGINWKFKADSGISFEAADFNNNFIFTSKNGKVYSVNKSGKKNWEFKTASGISASPAIYDKKVYFGGNDGNLYALSAISGNKIWSKEIGAVAFAKPVISRNIIYLGSSTGIFYALELNTGNEKWSFKTESGIYSTAAIKDNKVFVSSEDSYLYTLNKQDGSLIWKFKTGMRIVASSPVVIDNLVIFGSFDGYLYAVNTETGTKAWKTLLGGNIITSAVVNKNRIFIGSSNGKYFAVNVNSGKILWEVNLGNRIESTATVVDEKSIIGCNNGYVYIFSVKDGKELWKFKTGMKVKAKPIVAGKKIYIGSSDGIFYSLNLAE